MRRSTARVQNGVDPARLLAAADEARRRLERDLHDGAQQHFVVAALVLRRAQAESPGVRADSLVAEALEHLEHGLRELRDLARGIHPFALTERGLATALQGLVAKLPLPVELGVSGERLAPVIESAIYFVVSEALTNVVKHAHATAVTVQFRVEDRDCVVLVADDGVGGAEISNGSGLSGLADRVTALGGTLTVESPGGSGTLVRATVPRELS
jgi:signal transduction histidine kinase